MIFNFDDLLRSVREQAQPQRLLFVFTASVACGKPFEASIRYRRFASFAENPLPESVHP